MDESKPDNLDEAQQLIDELRATNHQLTETVTDLQSRVAWLTRQVFGSKSERVADWDEASLFDDHAEPEGADSSSSHDESNPNVTY